MHSSISARRISRYNERGILGDVKLREIMYIENCCRGKNITQEVKGKKSKRNQQVRNPYKIPTNPSFRWSLPAGTLGKKSA